MKISSQILLDIIEEETYNVLKEGIFTSAYQSQLDLMNKLGGDDSPGEDAKKQAVSKRDLQFVQMYLKTVVDASFKNAIKKNVLPVLSQNADANKQLLLQVYTEYVQSKFEQLTVKEAIGAEEYKKLKGILVILEVLVRENKNILELFRRKLDEVYNKNPIASGLFKKKSETINQIKKESEVLIRGVSGFLSKMVNERRAKVKEYESTVMRSGQEFQDVLKNGKASEIMQNIKEKYKNDFATVEASTGINEVQLKEILGSKIHQEMLSLKKKSEILDYFESIGMPGDSRGYLDFLRTLGVNEEQIAQIVTHISDLK